jgi:hypothetical protein
MHNSHTPLYRMCFELTTMILHQSVIWEIVLLTCPHHSVTCGWLLFWLLLGVRLPLVATTPTPAPEHVCIWCVCASSAETISSANPSTPLNGLRISWQRYETSTLSAFDFASASRLSFSFSDASFLRKSVVWIKTLRSLSSRAHPAYKLNVQQNMYTMSRVIIELNSIWSFRNTAPDRKARKLVPVMASRYGKRGRSKTDTKKRAMVWYLHRGERERGRERERGGGGGGVTGRDGDML